MSISSEFSKIPYVKTHLIFTVNRADCLPCLRLVMFMSHIIFFSVFTSPFGDPVDKAYDWDALLSKL